MAPKGDNMSVYEMLFDWQKRVIDKFRDRQSFGLFLDMGLGKTPLSIAFAEQNRCEKVIVITINAKAIETVNDNGSWSYWASKSNMQYDLLNKSTTMFDERRECFIINYEALFARGRQKTQRTTLKQNVIDFIKSCKNKNVAIIVDESHKIKNLQSQQTRAIVEIKRELKRISSKVYTYLLTGTPFTTGYIDLYSQLKLLGCEMTKGQFIDDFCIRGQIQGLFGWQQPIVGYKNINSLFNLVHQYAITIKSEDVINLPEKVFSYFSIGESEDFSIFCQEKINVDKYIDYVKRKHTELCCKNDVLIAYDMLDSNLKRKKVGNNPFYRDIDYPQSRWIAETSGQFWLRARQLSIGFNGSSEDAIWYDKSRLNKLKDFLSNNEDNYVLFYNYTPELLELYEICESLGYNIDVYCGECKSLHFYKTFEQLSDSEKLVTKKNIILANFASGSTGMNWQEYNKCIIFSLPIFSHYEQGIKRIHRTGQKKTTFYYVFYQNNFLDNSMINALKTCQEYDAKMFESDLKRVNSLTSE